MAVIPVQIKKTTDDLPRIKAEVAALNAEERKALTQRMRDLGFQRRLENEITRETKNRIREQRQLNRLSQSLTRELEKQEKAQKKIQAERAERIQRGAGIAGGLIAGGVVATAEAVKQAEQARVTESAFNNLSGSIENARDNTEAMQRATRGLVSEQQQQQIANQLLGMQIVSTSEELEKVVSVSRRLGKEFRGLGAEEAANEFAIMMSNMSVQRLDTFGISSGKVRERIEELMATTEGMTRETAFFQATMEEADKTLARLGPELSTATDEVSEFQAKIGDLQVAWGSFIVESGALSGVTGLLGEATDAVEGLSSALGNASLISDALSGLTPNIDLSQVDDVGKSAGRLLYEATVGGFEDISQGKGLAAVFFGGGGADSLERAREPIEDVASAFGDLGTDISKLIFGEQELTEAFVEAGQEADSFTENVQKNTAAIEDNSEALEEEGKRLEKVASLRERSVRKMIEVDERFAEDTQETWQDWREDQEDLFEDYGEKRTSILEKAAKDTAKIEKDLQKDLSKLSKDTAKDLEKIDRDEKRKLNELKTSANKEERQEEKKRRVQVLGDRRLFLFDLQQLGAEGNANAIKEALERRDLEEQIEKEKQAVEGQIKDENLRDDIERVKEEAEERRAEQRQEAEERRAELQAEAEEERALKEEALQQALEDEKQNFLERSAEMADFRDDKLAQLEQDKADTIAKIGEELTEIQDITKEELAKLVPIFAEFGDEAGNAFSTGLSKGFDTNKMIEELTGQKTGAKSRPSTTAGRGAGFGKNPGMLSFDTGGVVPGPLGAPQLAVVHGGETITPPGQSNSVTVNVQPGMERLAAIVEMKMNEALQIYTDEILGPALS